MNCIMCELATYIKISLLWHVPFTRVKSIVGSADIVITDREVVVTTDTTSVVRHPKRHGVIGV